MALALSSCASASYMAESLTTPLISGLPAYMLVSGHVPTWWQIGIWMFLVSLIGVLLAFVLDPLVTRLRRAWLPRRMWSRPVACPMCCCGFKHRPNRCRCGTATAAAWAGPASVVLASAARYALWHPASGQVTTLVAFPPDAPAAWPR